MAKKQTSPKKVIGFFLLCTSILGLYLSRFELLGLMGQVLVKDDSKNFAPADYIVVLMGDLSSSRANAALNLWKKDPKQTLIMMEENKFGFIKLNLMPPPSSVHKAYFERAGVPQDKIRILDNCGVDSTLDEAKCLFSYLKKNRDPAKHLNLVTSFYHSSRAFWIFSHVFHNLGKEGITISMIPAQALDLGDPQTPETLTVNPDLWWKREDLFLAVFNEYLKWTYWKFKGLPRALEAEKELTDTSTLYQNQMVPSRARDTF